MSSRTWTPGALSRERRRLAGSCWRVVESQSRASTMKLVDTLEEQETLEILIDETKPPVPEPCRHLDYLLFTPFRYGAPYPEGSRFRRAGFTPGVFYASDTPAIAIAEMAFHRLLFFADSPATPWPVNAGELTVFSSTFASDAALDLTGAPLNRDRARWTDLTDYSACQDLADQARAAEVDVLRYESPRDPSSPPGSNIAILGCGAFSSRRPAARQTWRMHLGAHGVRAFCAWPDQRIGFGKDAFANDPRIARLRWER
jgi:RES domain-containing protein